MNGPLQRVFSEAVYRLVLAMGWSDLDEVYLTLSQESADSVEEAEACRSDSDTECIDMRPRLPTLPSLSSASSRVEADCDCGASCASSDIPSITTAGGCRKPAPCEVWWKDSIVSAARHLKCKEGFEPATPLKFVSTCSGLLAEAAALQVPYLQETWSLKFLKFKRSPSSIESPMS